MLGKLQRQLNITEGLQKGLLTSNLQPLTKHCQEKGDKSSSNLTALTDVKTRRHQTSNATQWMLPPFLLAFSLTERTLVLTCHQFIRFYLSSTLGIIPLSIVYVCVQEPLVLMVLFNIKAIAKLSVGILNTDELDKVIKTLIISF